MIPASTNPPSNATPKIFSCNLDVKWSSVEDVVKACLFNILFLRTLGTIKPRTVELMGLTFLATNDEESNTYVRNQASVFQRLFSDNKEARGKIVIRFLEKRSPKKNWFGSSRDTEVSWEEWHINVDTVAVSDDQEITTREQLQKFLFGSLKFVNQDNSHIPPITNSSVNPFPFQITSELITDEPIQH